MLDMPFHNTDFSALLKNKENL